MDRRTAFTNLSGIAATSLLLALPAKDALAQSMSGMAPEAMDYKRRTLMIGTLSKMGSQMALSQAMHPQVRQFAHFEIDEQTTIAQVLTDMEAPPPAPLGPEAQAQLSQLQSAGQSFDAAYIQFEIEGHQKLYQVQEMYLDGSPANMDRKHIAMLARTVIKMHLTMLGDLQRMVA